ncbi:hypothetical protein ScPMuIL_002378 [Solemya velum]
MACLMLFFGDNGPCYNSTEFRYFAAEWEFNHKTSSPRYLKSNGLVDINRSDSVTSVGYQNAPNFDGELQDQRLWKRSARSMIHCGVICTQHFLCSVYVYDGQCEGFYLKNGSVNRGVRRLLLEKRFCEQRRGYTCCATGHSHGSHVKDRQASGRSSRDKHPLLCLHRLQRLRPLVDSGSGVYSVHLLNRDNCAGRMSNINVFVGVDVDWMEWCNNYQGPAKPSEEVILECLKIGRHVKVTGGFRFCDGEITENNPILTLCEVMVFGQYLSDVETQ